MGFPRWREIMGNGSEWSFPSPSLHVLRAKGVSPIFPRSTLQNMSRQLRRSSTYARLEYSRIPRFSLVIPLVVPYYLFTSPPPQVTHCQYSRLPHCDPGSWMYQGFSVPLAVHSMLLAIVLTGSPSLGAPSFTPSFTLFSIYIDHNVIQPSSPLQSRGHERVVHISFLSSL